jgi:hypothetical protein
MKKHSTTLEVRPSTLADKTAIEQIFEREGFSYDYNEEFNVFELDELHPDALEYELEKIFQCNNINATYASF